MTGIISRIVAPATIMLALLLSASWVNAADSAAPHPRAALVIGNAAYRAVNPLKNTANDAHDMCDALTGLGYTAACYTDVKDAREFRARIQDFAAALKPKSEVVFYYAGHAIQVKGENYLVPISAKLRAEADVPKETVSLNYIMTQLVQAKHFVDIVILDACRSNPWGENSHGMTAGLAPITAIPRGTMVIYGTAANDVSDDGEGRNGTLTKNLLANITTPGLTADDFFKHVSEGVQNDSAAAVGHTQTPALYTNFGGEFCFAGCIDQVARAEMERQQKANDELLAQANKEKAELEARKREAEARNRQAEARLAAATTSTNCDQSIIQTSSQCFKASVDSTRRAIVATLQQRGMTLMRGAEEGDIVEANLKSENPNSKSLTDVLTITAGVQEVPVTHHTVVTFAVNQKSLLHDEYHTWGSFVLIPLPTSKQYRDVVKKDVEVTDPQLYHDLFAAVDQNLRSESSASIVVVADAPSASISPAPSATAEDAAGSNESATSPASPSSSPVMESVSSQQSFSASVELAQQALLRALVSQGYVIDSADPDSGVINATRWLQDSKDSHYSTRFVAAAQATADSASSCTIRIDATQMHVLHDAQHEWVFLPIPRPLGGSLHYVDVVKENATVSDAGFYRTLFAHIDDELHGAASAPQERSRSFAIPVTKTLHTVIDALAQLGYTDLKADDNLHFVTASSREEKQNSKKTERTSHVVDLTILVVPGAAGGSQLLVSGQTRDTFAGVQSVYRSLSSRALKQMLDSTGRNSMLFYQEGITHEGEADAALYQGVLTLIGRKLGS